MATKANQSDADKKPVAVQTPSNLVGSQAEPTVLGDTVKLDIDTTKSLVDNIINAAVTGGLNVGELESFTTISNARDQIYQLIDTMAKDSTVSALIRTYAEEVCEVADNGHIVWCESNDPNISKYVNYLLNVMNVDKNVFAWVYCLIKYGDVYLRLFRESDYDDELFNKDNIKNATPTRNRLNEELEALEAKQASAEKLDESVNVSIHQDSDRYSGYVEMVADPCTMFELTKYGKTYGYVETPNMPSKMDFTEVVSGANNLYAINYRLKSNDVNIYQADDFVHACLEDNFSRFPEQVELFSEDVIKRGKKKVTTNSSSHTYSVRRGKSLLYDSYKVWREKSLLENSAILNRVTRSSIVRTVAVEVGDMPKEKIKATLQGVKDLLEQRAAIKVGEGMSEYTNPGPIENNLYFATQGGKGNITIGSIGGDVEVKNLADLDWWNNKFYSSYGIPKQYFGWTDDGAGFNGGSSLTILSSVFAKGVKRVQNSILQAITDIINLVLINRGIPSYLNNFVLKMRAPLTQEELDYRKDLGDRVNAINNMQGLLTDIENKPRRLRILKGLISTLNYGDDIINEIQKEIDKLEQDEEKKKEEEEKLAAEQAALEAGQNPPPALAEAGGEEADLNADLGAAMDLMPTQESVEASEKQQLLEDQAIFESDDDLPTPEELDSEKDFTKNN